MTDKTGKPSKSVRPVWDTAVLSTTPAFLPPTHEEVKAFAQSLGRKEMTDEQRFIEAALRDEENCRANLESLRSSGGEQKYIDDNLRGLAQALKRLGRFIEAMAVVANEKGLPLAGFESTLSEIKKYCYAVEIDDDEFCDCPRPKEIIKDSRNKPVEIELNRRFALGQCFSNKHNKVVTVYECSVCGLPNAHNNIPERQIKVEEMRGVVASQVGKVFNEADFNAMTGMRDEILLKTQ
jgi:hypothetical protein